MTPSGVPHGLIRNQTGRDAYTYGVSVTYECRTGYKLKGATRLVCLTTGVWSSPAPECIPVTCPVPEVLSNSSVVALSHLFRAIAKYKCDLGYELKGSSRRICKATGEWSGAAPACEPTPCPAPANITHGLMFGASYTFQSIVSYSCQRGYTLEGPTERQCSANGNWTNTIPVCLPVRCPQPNTVNSGRIIGSVYHFQSVVDYVCDSGYILHGDQRRVCQSDGSWSGNTPVCKRTKCHGPETLQNGIIRSNAHEYEPGETIKYACHIGFEMLGKTTRTCKSDGTWTGHTPRCNVLFCVKPEKVRHGHVLAGDMSYGSMAEYSCDEGYQLDGPTTRMCSSDKQWSGNEPACEPILCPTPSNILHGNVNGKIYKLNAKISYICDIGYRLEGHGVRTCLKNKTWSWNAPWCKPIECSRPLNVIPNGRMISTNFSYGNTIRYVCDSGYLMGDYNSRTCGSDGRWNNTTPVCKPVACSPPSKPPHSIIDGFDFHFKGVIRYRCKVGYELMGAERRTCQADRTWSDDQPRCKRIECSLPDDVENGRVIVQTTFFRDEALYKCDVGYYLLGEPYLMCQEDKTWFGQVPRCLQVKCSPPPSIPNGIIMNERHYVFYGDVVQYRCDPGFVLSVSSMLTCSEHANYTGERPKCVKIQCDPPEQVPNADIVGSTDTLAMGYGDTIEYVCLPGFELHGNQHRRCSDRGTWSGQLPECRPITCLTPDPITNGLFNNTGDFHYGQRIVHSCNEGYVLEGSKIRKCELNRTWSGTEPKCRRVKCSYPFVDFGYVDFGEVVEAYAYETVNHEEAQKYDYDAVVTILCETGFVLKGEPDVKCTADETWRPALPMCERQMCSPLNIENGMVSHKDDVFYEAIVNISCLEGFRLIGNTFVTCQSEGVWQKPLPECVLVTCPAPVFRNGNVTVVRSPNKGVGYPYGITLKFECGVGFQMSGDSLVTCQDDGQWSGQVPRCKTILCSRPHTPSNSNTFVLTPGQRFQYGETIVIGCKDGYELPAPRELQCDHDGTWEGFIPTCIISQCPGPEFDHGEIYGRGRRRLATFQTGVVASFRCDRGWRLLGRSEVACLANKTWSSETPTCEKVKCPNIEIDYGQLLSKPTDDGFFQYGMKTSFLCRDGYELTSNKTLSCEADGRWSGPLPACLRVTCQPPLIANGQPYSPQSRYRFGDRVEVVCNEGYRPSDASLALTCQSDGTWSTNSPSCLIIFCPTLVLSSGEVHTVHPDKRQVPGMNIYGQTIQFKCNEGYRRNGDDFSVCQANGTWSRNAPRCEMIKCPQLSILNGQVRNARIASLTLGSRVSFECRPGYELIGDSQRVCVRDGEWSGQPAKCIAVECPSPSINNGRVVGSSPRTQDSRYTVGDTIRFVCYEGYELVGESEMTCQTGRTWSVYLPPRCDAIMCPPLPRIPNGEITASDQGSSAYFPLTRHSMYGTNVEVACMPGYQLDEGDSRLTCGPDKNWMGKVPTCVSMNCPAVALENGRVTGQSYVYTKDDIVRLVCDQGYQLTSDNVELSCLENGTWSAAYPRCTRRRCKDLVLQNGQIIGESFLYGDSVHFNCNEGYTLLGAPKCSCQSNGYWDCMPLCFRISCQRPSSMPHRTYVAAGFHYGDRLRYECEAGFDIEGDADHVCQANMEWTGDTPSCQRSICPEPEAPLHGFIIGDAFQYGDRIEYMCNTNHELVGSQFAECMADKSWGPTPSCVKISCPHPVAIRNGAVRGDNFHVHDVATYVCNDGYKLSGSAEIQCGMDKTWSGTIPECLRIQCPVPKPISNGFVLGNQYRYRSVIEYHCKRGHRLRGAHRRDCTANGTWNGEEPRCNIVTCNSLEAMSNGHISIDSYNFGSVIEYKCDYGFFLTGDATRRCQEDGVWTGRSSQCLVIECPTPQRIEHGYYSAIDNKVDSMLFYMCDPEYSLRGTPQRTCLENGSWSGGAPQCELKHCPRPANPANGNVSVGQLTPGSVVTYTCDEGYNLSDQASLTCNDGERWSHDFPVCNHISCGPPREIEQGGYSDISFNFGDTVTYHCNHGYILEGKATITCQANRFWSPIEGRCSRLGCGPTPAVNDSVHTRYPCEFGECIFYSCDDGYELKGNYMIQCGTEGTWLGPFPECHKVTCGPAPVIFHSSNIVIESTDGSRVIMYICNEGYILHGRPMLHCMQNGTWMYEDKPSCLPVNCGPLPEVQNSIVLVPEFTVGNIARYTCDVGFTMKGHPNLRCQESGVWNGTGPTCIGGACSAPEGVNHGYINGSDFSHGAAVEYVCHRGYVINGVSNRTCRLDGRWTGSPPSCTGTPSFCHFQWQLSSFQHFNLYTLILHTNMHACDLVGLYSIPSWHNNLHISYGRPLLSAFIW